MIIRPRKLLRRVLNSFPTLGEDQKTRRGLGKNGAAAAVVVIFMIVPGKSGDLTRARVERERRVML